MDLHERWHLLKKPLVLFDKCHASFIFLYYPSIIRVNMDFFLYRIIVSIIMTSIRNLYFYPMREFAVLSYSFRQGFLIILFYIKFISTSCLTIPWVPETTALPTENGIISYSLLFQVRQADELSHRQRSPRTFLSSLTALRCAHWCVLFWVFLPAYPFHPMCS